MGARMGRYGVGAVVALALGLSALAPTSALARDNEVPEEPTPAGSETVTMIQANILTTLKPAPFQKDARTVTSLLPDVISYNEVPFRHDVFLAPEGYAMYRDMSNRFTAATPVAWRTDRWTAVATGNQWISNWRGRPPGKQVELGRRTANWVRLQSVDGRVINVVSTHIAPPTRGMPDLLRRSIKSLDKLVAKLAPSGPVLVGGDFNVHYKSGRYPRDLFDASRLTPTYDVLGTSFPTGDHFGNTIDYLFSRGEGQLTATNHYAVELKSDHDAVVGEYTWLVDAPATISSVRNKPSGTRPEQRAVVKALTRAIDAAEAGSTVALRTSVFDLRGVLRSLRKALERGVHVQVMTANDAPTGRERTLGRAVAAHGDPDSWVQACGGGCLPSWREAGMPPALLMVGDAAGEWTTRFDANRMVVSDLTAMPSRVKIQSGPIALEGGAALLAGGAG
ncbi:endonuclease/exonuclease/phosphatase family protein [Nocardioides pyridinolyticus]